MKISSTILMVGLWAASSAAAQMHEEVVTLVSDGQPFVGTLARPDGAAAPVVLLLHGFTGSRDELATDHVPSGVFGHTAAQLAEAGYASLRIDFRGSGESLADLSFADTTFEGQVRDGLAALDYLANAESVLGDEVYVIGWSQGGLVASAVAGRSGAPRAVALWNAVGTPMQTYGGLFGDDAVQDAIAATPDAAMAFALPWGAEVTLKGGFFDQVAQFDPLAEIAAYKGPLLVAQGDKDTVVLPENGPKYIEAHSGPERLWTAEMDHAFNVFAEASTLDTLIDETIAYFNEVE